MRGSEIVEAQWTSERRGFERFRTEQPNYSILDREIEREILPVAAAVRDGHARLQPARRRHADRPLPGRPGERQLPFQRGRACATSATSAGSPRSSSSIALADEIGVKLTHLAMAFVIAHPGVTSAIAGPRTMEQLEDTLAGVDVVAVGRGARPHRRDRAAGREHRRDGHGLPRPRGRRPGPAPPAGRPALGRLTAPPANRREGIDMSGRLPSSTDRARNSFEDRGVIASGPCPPPRGISPATAAPHWGGVPTSARRRLWCARTTGVVRQRRPARSDGQRQQATSRLSCETAGTSPEPPVPTGLRF